MGLQTSVARCSRKEPSMNGTVTLSNGIAMPQIGLGRLPRVTDVAVCESSVTHSAR